MQNQYNLLRRQDEPELMAMCADMGVGLVPYSPQGKGRLARPWGEQSLRSTVDKVVQSFDSPLDEPVVNAVQQVAEARGLVCPHTEVVDAACAARRGAVRFHALPATWPRHRGPGRQSPASRRRAAGRLPDRCLQWLQPAARPRYFRLLLGGQRHPVGLDRRH